MFYKKTVLSLAVLGLILGGGLIATNAYQGDPAVTGPNHTPENHAAVTEAFVNQDYTAWQTAMAGHPIADKVSSEDFAKFAEAWQLAQDGKLDEARALRQELGLGNGIMLRGVNKGQGQGQGNGQGIGNKMMQRGAGMGGQFVDADGNGVCDNLDQ